MHVPPFNIPNLRIDQRKTSSAEDMARKNSTGSISNDSISFFLLYFLISTRRQGSELSSNFIQFVNSVSLLSTDTTYTSSYEQPKLKFFLQLFVYWLQVD